MTSTTELIDRVKELHEALKNGAIITDRILKPFTHCEGARISSIKGTGVHEVHCLWSYYVSCSKCGHQANLAKMLPGYKCECRRK